MKIKGKSNRRLANKIATALFGSRETIRLAMKIPHPSIADKEIELGGWCKAAVVQQILLILNEQ